MGRSNDLSPIGREIVEEKQSQAHILFHIWHLKLSPPFREHTMGQKTKYRGLFQTGGQTKQGSTSAFP